MRDQKERDAKADAYRSCSLLALAATLLLSAFVAYRIFISRGVFQEQFDSFGMRLPQFSHLVLSPWYAWLVPLLAALSVIKEIGIKNGRTTLAWNGVHLILVMVIWQLYATGVFLPQVSLIKGLQ